MSAPPDQENVCPTGTNAVLEKLGAFRLNPTRPDYHDLAS
jgi:hypothetical protein